MKYNLILWDWSGTLILNGELNPIALEFLHKNQNTHHGIVSNHNNINDIKTWITQVNISHYFNPQNSIIVKSEGYKSKPDPEMYYALLDRLNIQSHNIRCLFIGDSESDELFAEKIGADFLHINQLNRIDICSKII